LFKSTGLFRSTGFTSIVLMVQSYTP
jgi:hypothetical protein